MLNLNSIGKPDAEILRSLDRSDNKTSSSDNKIILKGLSQEDKNKLRETLMRVSESTELSHEDKVAITFTLKALNGEKGGASFLELKDSKPSNVTFPEPTPKKEVKVEDKTKNEVKVEPSYGQSFDLGLDVSTSAGP